jgi:hypothetical protein
VIEVVNCVMSLVMRFASKLGAAETLEKTGIAGTFSEAPLLVFVTKLNVMSPVITAFEKSTAFPLFLVACAAAAISQTIAAAT